MIRSRFAARFTTASLLTLALGAAAHAGVPVPAYNSRPGAAYTLYLDFGGFAFNGNWGSPTSFGTPGTTPAYTTDGDATTFTAGELTNIQKIWARTAEKYTGMNVNVTTVDPAVAAGQAGTDTARQNYYDSTAQTMHTVVGGSGSWTGGGGISFVGTTQNSQTGSNGYHTNWVFSAQAPTSLQFVAEATAHENGHGLKLNHQSDLTVASGSNREYSVGDNTNSGGSSYAPIMGNSYSNTRGLWRTGTLNSTTVPSPIQNDMQTLLTNTNMTTFVDDGIGHGLATATSLALSGSNVDSSLAQGFLTPSSSTAPTAIGTGNYTTDFFKFMTNGTAISLKLNAGAERIAIGTADDGATFDGYFNILDAGGNIVGASTRAANTLSYSFAGTLGAGVYYAQVLDFGGYRSTREAGTSANNPYNVDYFTSGSYFFSGSGGFVNVVPEPGTWAVLGLGGLALLRRRRKSA